MKKTVLIIDNSLGITGAFNAILHSSVDLKDFYDFVFVIPINSSNDKVLSNEGFRVYKLKMVEINRNVLNNLSYFFYLSFNTLKILKIIARHSVKIVHVNDIYNLLGISTRILTSVKLIIHARRLKNSFPSIFFESWMFLGKIFSHQIIAVSNAVWFQVNHNKTEMIYDRIPMTQDLPELNFLDNTGKFKMLYLANFTFGKGQQHALEVMKILVKQKGYDDISLTFAGDDFNNPSNIHFKKELISKSIDYGLESKVQFKNFIRNVEQEMKSHDVVLNFSESESFSFTCVESLFYGVPLIATNSGGPAELFEHAISGYLVEKKDYLAMVSHILTLKRDVGLRKKISKDGKKYVKQKFSFENTSLKLKQIYIKLIQ